MRSWRRRREEDKILNSLIPLPCVYVLESVLEVVFFATRLHGGGRKNAYIIIYK
jgi:hypothetical protein